MATDGSSMASKAFGDGAGNGLIVSYESHRAAQRFVSSALSDANGVAMLQGPPGSGKTTIMQEQLAWLKREAPVAFLDGGREATRPFVAGMLAQFGVDIIPDGDAQMLRVLSNYLAQQTKAGRAPILVVDNADRLGSSTLSLLNWLAAQDVRDQWALRIVLTGEERLAELAANHSMRHLERRHPAVFSLNPLSRREAVNYLRTRMIVAGAEDPEQIFPLDVCERLHELSRGWPGQLNDLAMEALVRMDGLRDTRNVPLVIVTRDGTTVAEYAVKQRETIIGRDKMADIVINDSYVSKLHAMLQLYANGIVLLDLNSTNGTLVNSVETKKAVLRNNDIITLGNHRLKVENVPAISPEMAEKIKRADPLTLKNLEDVRRSRALHNIAAIKHRQ
jgi:general secretion pathway protein A